MSLTDWSNIAVAVASLGIICWIIVDARRYAKRATVEAEQDAIEEAGAFAIQHPIRRESIADYIERVKSGERLNNGIR